MGALAQKDRSSSELAEFGGADYPDLSSLSTSKLPVATFSQVFMSALVLAGSRKIDFSSNDDLAGIKRLHSWISELVENLKAEPSVRSSQIYFDLVAIRNQLQMSETGSFDGFEEMLSAQQTWLASKLNPSLTKFSIEMGDDLAKYTLQRQPKQIVDMVNFLARLFSGH